jgi:hypothetical protein
MKSCQRTAGISSEIVESAGDLHDQILKATFEVTKDIGNNSTTLDTADHMLDADSISGDHLVDGFGLRGELLTLGFFQWHQQVGSSGLKSLKTAVLKQGAFSRKATVFNFSGNGAIMTRARMGGAQVNHAPSRSEDDVLVGVGLFLAAIVRFLLILVLRPSRAPIGAIHDQSQIRTQAQNLVQFGGLTLGQFHFATQSRFQHRCQSMNPGASLPLAQAPEKSHRLLDWVKLEVHQNEKQLVPSGRDPALEPSARTSLPLSPFKGLVGILFAPFLFKGKEQLLKFPMVQRGDRAHRAPVIQHFFDFHVPLFT